MRSLTRGQKVVLTLATAPMVAVGIGGAVGTYANAASVLHREETALGVVAAGEGATLVAALVMLGLTMLGQPAPGAVRAALWLLPTSASVMGLAIAPTPREAVVFGITPLAMTVSAEGLGLLARRIVVHRTGTDVEAQRRNAATMRRIAYHRARADRHPTKWIRNRSALKAWRLMSRVGEGDTELGSGLITVQRTRLTRGADAALGEMLTGSRELAPGEPVPSSEPERELSGASDFDTFADRALHIAASEPRPEPAPPVLPPPATAARPADQRIHGEPGAIPSEPPAATTPEPTLQPAVAQVPEPTPEPRPDHEPEPDQEPHGDPREGQIIQLASLLRRGERLTKTSAATLLGVSPATAGRRLKDARDRLDDGTGMYL